MGLFSAANSEPRLLSLAERLRSDRRAEVQSEPVISLARIEFLTPDRTGLPPLARYAHLQMPDGSAKVVGFAEGSRGCKHWCRHCPVVPVYQGKFRVVQVPVVLADIRSQVAMGAEHISFGDPDFLNGPTHALKLARALHAEFPDLSFDATIKVQHLIEHAMLLPELKRCGCLYVTSAVEAVDDRILEYLDKNHSAEDFGRAVALLRQAGIAFAPTFVAFTPWTTLDGYVDLLRRLIELELVESVPPIQLCIRLLVPEGSYLLKLAGFRDLIRGFRCEDSGLPLATPRRPRRCAAAASSGVCRESRGRGAFAPPGIRANLGDGSPIPRQDRSAARPPEPRLVHAAPFGALVLLCRTHDAAVA